MVKAHISTWHITGKTVILHIDTDVPIAHQQILDDHKLVASMATINYLLDQGAQLIIVAYTQGKNNLHTGPSWLPIVDWFNHEGVPMELASSVHEAKQLLAAGKRTVMLENVSFFAPSEEHIDLCMQEIKTVGTYFVHDAFGTLVHQKSPITTIANHFDAAHKSIGFLVEHELAMLTHLKQNIHKPFLLFVGGAEPTKIDLIQSLLPFVDALYIGPAINFSFLKASGIPVGKSHIMPEFFNDCHAIMMSAEERGIPIYFPLDYVMLEPDNPYYEISSSDQLNQHEYGVSIGPKTATAWAHDCLNAKTIMLHGLMGFLHNPEGLLYFRHLLQSIHDSSATSIITGSSTIAAMHLLGLAYDMHYCSTGGETTLAYLGNRDLPGLYTLMNRTES